MGVICLVIFEILNLILKHSIDKYLFDNDVSVFVSIAAGILIYFTLMIKSGGIRHKDILKLPMGRRIFKTLKKVPFLRDDLSKTT